MVDTLRVSETFRSIQGEGPSTGETAVFLRLADCNLKCTWCDTPYSWNWASYKKADNTEPLTPSAAAARIRELAADTARLLVVTGGEPMLQQPSLHETLTLINEKSPGIRFEIETNGTVPPSPSLNETVFRYIVSPKLSNAGGTRNSRIRLKALRGYTGLARTNLKFVVASLNDFTELLAIVELLDIPTNQVWIMPEARDRRTLLAVSEAIAPHVVALGFNLSTRLHILLWGDQPGR
jgi:7-carboxy-7-deazaguanine synthase